MSKSDATNMEHTQKAGGAETLLDAQKMRKSLVTSSPIDLPVKRRREPSLDRWSDSEVPHLREMEARPNIRCRRSRERLSKLSTDSSSLHRQNVLVGSGTPMKSQLASYSSTLHDETVDNMASTTMHVLEDTKPGSNDSGNKEGSMDSASNLCQSPSPQWSYYEQDSVLVTPLRALINEEDDQAESNDSHCMRRHGSRSNGVSLDAVKEHSTGAESFNSSLDRIGYEVDRGLRPQSAEVEGKAAKRFCDSGPSGSAEASITVLTPAGVGGEFDGSVQRKLTVPGQMDENLKTIAGDNVPWPKEGLTASDFLKAPLQGSAKDEAERIESHMKAGACVKKRRRQKKVSEVPNCSKQYAMRCVSKKKKITFKNVKVYYFERSQGFTAIPTSGGVTLGMTAKHHDAKEFSISEFETLMRNEQIARYRKRRAERAARSATANEPIVPSFSSVQQQPSSNTTHTLECDTGRQVLTELKKDEQQKELTSAVGDHERERECTSTDDTDEEQLSDEDEDEEFDEEDEELETSCYIMQPVGGRSRRAMLKAAGVQLDRSEAPICHSIRASRQHCGCTCADGVCTPETCECAKDAIKCQVDRPSFPCPCVNTTCNNPEGRVEFNALRVRAHYLETMMRMRVLESGDFNDPNRVCSPQHIRFEESIHESSSYCNPPPPLPYRQVNAIEWASQQFDCEQKSSNVSVTDTTTHPGECCPCYSQQSEETTGLSTAPTDMYERCQLDPSREIATPEMDDDVSVNVTMKLDVNRDNSAEASEGDAK